MFRLNKLKGFTLIEVICSLSIFSILFIYLSNFQFRNINLIKYNNEINGILEYVRALENNIIYKYEFEEIEEMCNEPLINGTANKFYINKDEINLEVLKRDRFRDIVTKVHISDPYIELQLSHSGENVIKIFLICHTDPYIKGKVIETSIYKGDY